MFCATHNTGLYSRGPCALSGARLRHPLLLTCLLIFLAALSSAAKADRLTLSQGVQSPGNPVPVGTTAIDFSFTAQNTGTANIAAYYRVWVDGLLVPANQGRFTTTTAGCGVDQLFPDYFSCDLSSSGSAGGVGSPLTPGESKSLALRWNNPPLNGSVEIRGSCFYYGVDSNSDGFWDPCPTSSSNTLSFQPAVDPSILNFSAGTYSVNENGRSVVIAVTRSGNLADAISVQYATSNGSATAGEDYTATSGTLVWDNTVGGSQQFTVPISDDGLLEGNETVNLLLDNPTGAAVLGDRKTAILTIVDVEAGTLSVDKLIRVREDARVASVTVSRSNGSSGRVTVDYATVDGTATAGGDYVASGGTLTWDDGDVRPKTVDIAIVDDAIVETAEQFAVALSSPTGGATLGSNVGTVEITDVEPGELKFTAAAFSVDENAGTVNISVARSNGSSGTVSVDYATSGGTATDGVDFASSNGTLSWANGDSAPKTLAVPIIDDALVEGNESLFVALRNVVGGARIGEPSQATLTIVDVEAAGSLQFSATNFSVDEGAGAATITVTRREGSSGAVAVAYAASNGTASGDDYRGVSGVLEWASGDTAAKSFSVPIVDDAALEGNETVVLTLSDPTNGATLGIENPATLSIVDNDVVQVSVAATRANASEDNPDVNTGEFTFNLSAVSANGLTVFYSVGGTARPGDNVGDYQPLSGSVAVPPGASSVAVAVVPRDDAEFEGPETVVVTITPSSNQLYAVRQPNSATVTIADNDVVPRPTATVVASDATAEEQGSGTGTFTVMLDEPAGPDGTTISYTVGGTAASGSDYLPLPASVTLLPNARSATITVQPVDDAAFEGNETVTITLSEAAAYYVGTPDSAVLTIVDNDAEFPAPAPGERILVQLVQGAATVALAQPVDFVIRVADSAQAAIPGAAIEWTLDQASAGLGAAFTSAETLTDENGHAAATLQTVNTPALYQVTVRARVTDTQGNAISATATFSTTGGLIDSVAPNTPESAAAAAMDSFCPELRQTGELTPEQQALLDRCNELFQASEEGRGREIANALRAITPEEVAAQGEMGNKIANQQVQNLASRLDTLRAGMGGGLALSGLSLRVNGQTLPASLFDELLADLRGVSAGDKGNQQVDGLLDQRLGIFITGNLGFGDRDTTANESGYQFSSLGITGGADYRFTDKLFVGGALGIARTDVDYDSNGGNLKADGFSLSAYGLYHQTDQLHFSAVLTYGNNNYDSKRNIDYTVAGTSVARSAKGSTDANTLSVSFGTGYRFVLEQGLTTEFLARYDYTSSGVGGYTEHGAQELNMAIDDQDLESSRFVAGGRVLQTFSRTWGVVIPQAQFNWEHQAEGAYTISANFVTDPSNTTYKFVTDEPDSNFFRFKLGVTAVFPGGVSGFIQYDTVLGREHYSEHDFSFGGRWERRF